jgi:hypothetical protein
MNIISASRRTDIPAFYSEWLIDRIRIGSVSYPNPFSGEVYTISLLPDDVHSIVFWSKHYAPLLPHLGELDDRGYRYVFHYTITGAARTLEPHVPVWQEEVKALRALSARTSPRHVTWRFDPILLTDELDASFHLQAFRSISSALEGSVERCVFSFATFYAKVRQQLKRAGIRYVDPPLEAKRALVGEMADVAEQRGITLQACCWPDLVGDGVKQAHCVDGELLAQLFPDRPAVTELRPTRDGCGCSASRDIGMYDTCPYGCAYCYANRSRELALRRYRAHDPQGEMLVQLDADASGPGPHGTRSTAA